MGRKSVWNNGRPDLKAHSLTAFLSIPQDNSKALKEEQTQVALLFLSRGPGLTPQLSSDPGRTWIPCPSCPVQLPVDSAAPPALARKQTQTLPSNTGHNTWLRFSADAQGSCLERAGLCRRFRAPWCPRLSPLVRVDHQVVQAFPCETAHSLWTLSYCWSGIAKVS